MLHLDSEWTVADLDDGEEGCNFTPLIENFKQRNGHLGDPYPPPPSRGRTDTYFRSIPLGKFLDPPVFCVYFIMSLTRSCITVIVTLYIRRIILSFRRCLCLVQYFTASRLCCTT